MTLIHFSELGKYLITCWDTPGLAKFGYQGQLHSTETKRKYADDTFKNKKVIEFNIQLMKGHYTNFHCVHLCLPLKVKLAATTPTT